jgi:hypothetical protein
MLTARTLEADWRQVVRGSVNTEAEEDESSTGHFWAAGFYHIMAHSCLACILKLTNRLFNFQFFFSGCGKLQILNQRMQGTSVHYISKVGSIPER